MQRLNSPLLNGIAVGCLFVVLSCGSDNSNQPSVNHPAIDVIVSSVECGAGLAARDLANNCRAHNPSMGALEAQNE